jgi:hypothetical protein
MTRSTHQKLSDMGVEARNVLGSPAFEEAFTRMQAAIDNAWHECDMRDTEGQRLLLQQAKLVGRVKATLQGMIEQGNLADSKINADDIRNESGIRRGIRAVTGR